MIDTHTRANLGEYLKLFKLRRGEEVRAYDEVAAVYDGFVRVWDRFIAADALTYYNQLIAKYTKPDSTILDAGAGYLLIGVAAAGRDPLTVQGLLFYLVSYLFMNLGVSSTEGSASPAACRYIGAITLT